MNDIGLYAALAVAIGAMVYKVDIKVLDPVEKQLQAAAGLGIIAFIQTFLGGKKLVDHPQKIENFLESSAGRFIMLYVTLFAMTSDFEIAFFVTMAYLIFVHILRTPEERKKNPYLI